MDSSSSWSILTQAARNRRWRAGNPIKSTGWWFGTWRIYDFPLGMSSSQLLLTPSFFRGVNHQPVQCIYMIICIPYKTLIYISCIPDFPASHVWWPAKIPVKSIKFTLNHPTMLDWGGLLCQRGGLDLGSIAVLRHGDDVYCGPLGGVVLTGKGGAPILKNWESSINGGGKGETRITWGISSSTAKLVYVGL